MSAHAAAAPVNGATVGALLAAARARLTGATSTPRLDAEVLLAHCTGARRVDILAFGERGVDAAAARRFVAVVERRAAGVPVAHLTGAQEFYSLPLAVTPAVLVPRPETELLVDAALQWLDAGCAPTVCDLGTGSGAVALAIKCQRPATRVTAVDSDPAALAVAHANAARLGLELHCIDSDWFAALAGERFGVIVANPPYVRSGDPGFRGSLRHEPRRALDGGEDGLDAYRAILAGAPAHLAPGGRLLLEHGHDQRAALIALAAAAGFTVVAAHDDLAGIARVLTLRVR